MGTTADVVAAPYAIAFGIKLPKAALRDCATNGRALVGAPVYEALMKMFRAQC